jgi:hypothetical protein
MNNDDVVAFVKWRTTEIRGLFSAGALPAAAGMLCGLSLLGFIDRRRTSIAPMASV